MLTRQDMNNLRAMLDKLSDTDEIELKGWFLSGPCPLPYKDAKISAGAFRVILDASDAFWDDTENIRIREENKELKAMLAAERAANASRPR